MSYGVEFERPMPRFWWWASMPIFTAIMGVALLIAWPFRRVEHKETAAGLTFGILGGFGGIWWMDTWMERGSRQWWILPVW